MNALQLPDRTYAAALAALRARHLSPLILDRDWGALGAILDVIGDLEAGGASRHNLSDAEAAKILMWFGESGWFNLTSETIEAHQRKNTAHSDDRR